MNVKEGQLCRHTILLSAYKAPERASVALSGSSWLQASVLQGNHDRGFLWTGQVCQFLV